ncbi:MAG: Lrp/AsnC family transcriptional regulator, partial [Streptomycetaceae bacterium]|nr:Lrp/AsnC family transcriptional regulator [Streptomycetaceae bacterium]
MESATSGTPAEPGARHAVDDVDRAIVHALEIDGRAPFAKIAKVIGVSEQTVARRYRRLRDSGARVVRLVNRGAGMVGWMVRIRSTPDAAVPLAEALARRSDTSWVELCSGGTEICCVVRSRRGPEADNLLRHLLPRTPNVVDITAQSVLYVAHGGPASWVAKTSVLTPDQIAELDPGYGIWEPEPQRAEPALALTDADDRLFDALALDGRAGFAELAEASGLSESAARRRVDQLRAARLLSFEMDIEPAVLGHHTTAHLRMSVPPRDLTDVLAEATRHPEMVFLAATTGATNVVATVVCRDEADLYRYLTTRVAALTQITWVECVTVFRRVKREGAVLP